MRAVARIDNSGTDQRSEEVRSSGGRVAHDNQVNLQSFNVLHRIEQRLALAQTAGIRLNIDDIGGKTLFRELEGSACARARFDEQVHNGFSAQSGNLLDFPLGDFFELRRSVENAENLFRGEVVQAQQILFCPVEIHGYLQIFFS